MSAPKKTSKKAQPKAEAPEPIDFRNLDKGGLFAGVPAALYHSDPLPTPSVSNHFLQTMEAESPRHAWLTHPRLNPGYRLKPGTDEQNFGSAAHAAILGAGRVKIIPARNYQADFAKTARAQALANGEIPILQAKWETVQEMKRVLLSELDDVDSPIANVFDPKYRGRPEVMAAWQEDGLWCRALSDWWLSPFEKLPFAPNGWIIDLKFTFQSARGDAWPRTLYSMNGQFQPAWYRHGFHRAMMQAGANPPLAEPRFGWIVQEAYEPFAWEYFELDDVGYEDARNDVSMAFSRTIACFTQGEWPKYPRRINRVTPPAWKLTRDEFRRVASDVMQRGI